MKHTNTYPSRRDGEPRNKARRIFASTLSGILLLQSLLPVVPAFANNSLKVQAGSSYSLSYVLDSSGSEAPDGAFIWDISKGGTVSDKGAANEADADKPSRWKVRYDATKKKIYVTTPNSGSTLVAGDYKVRVVDAGTNYSATFTVTAPSGTIGLFNNGAMNFPEIPGISVRRSDGTFAAPPAWVEPMMPSDRVFTGTSGPSSADVTNLATGIQTHTPPADIIGRNVEGPDAPYKRLYKTSQAYAGASAPGLPAGWSDNWSFSLAPQTAGSWSAMVLTHPDGGQEAFYPILTNGTPTGDLSGSPASPYIVSGVAGGATGTWASITLSFDDLTKWTFTPSASDANRYVLSKIANIAGKYITIERDSSLKITAVKDTTGLALLSFAYDGSNNLSTVTDNQGRLVKYAYGTGAGVNELVSTSQITTAAGVATAPNSWEYGYTAVQGKPFLTSVGAPNAATGTGMISHPIAYDANGRAIESTDADGNKRSYTYNANYTTQVTLKGADNVPAMQWTEQFDPIGRSTGFTDGKGKSGFIYYGDARHPDQGTFFGNRRYNPASPNNNAVGASYDFFGNLLSAVDSRGIRTTITYDYSISKRGLPLTVQTTNTQNGISRAPTSYEYYPTGQLKAVYGPKSGQVAPETIKLKEYTYTPLGQYATTSELNSAGTYSTYTYNYTTDGAYTQAEKLGQYLTITDPLGKIARFRYDTDGRTTEVTDQVAAKTTYAYTPAGKIKTVTFPKVLATNPQSARTEFTYSSDKGDLVKIEDFNELGASVRVRSSQRNNEAVVKGATTGTGVNKSPKMIYDSAGRPVKRIDSNGNETLTVYDAAGNVTQSILPEGNIRKISYDDAGGVIATTNARNQTTTYTRDPIDGRVTGISSAEDSSINFTSTFDSFSRLTRIDDATGTRQYTYDEADNITQVTTQYTGMALPFSVGYAYNTDGSMKSMTTPVGIFNYTYDVMGQVAQIQSPWNPGSSYKYTWGDSGLLRVQETSKYQTKINYNARGWASGLYHNMRGPSGFAPPAAIYSYAGMTYDAFGNVTRYNVVIPPTGAVKDSSGQVTLTYDADQRLMGMKQTFTNNTANPGYTYDVTRDKNGEITSARNVQLIRDKNHQVVAAGHGQDADGNLTTHPKGTTTYDAKKRPTNVLGKVNQAWRSDGKRAVKTEVSTGKKSFFVYDELGSGLPIIELKADGNVYAGYSWGPIGIVQRYLEDPLKNDYTTILSDLMGNPVLRHKQTDPSPSSVSIYDAFGQPYSDLLASTGQAYPPIDPIGGGFQNGAWTDEQLKTAAPGFAMVGNKYWDAFEGKYMTIEDRFGPTTNGNEDDGRETVLAFQLLSAIPVFGAPFSLAMGVSDLQDGDYLGAALNIAGAACSAVEGAGMANKLRGGASFGKAGTLVAESANLAKTEAKVGQELSEAAQARSSCLPGSGSCFIEGTPILMADGTSKPIEQIKRGDVVLSRNSSTGETKGKFVLDSWSKQAQRTLLLSFSDGSKIETTEDHPFYAEGQGWIVAGDLAIGNSIATRAGPRLGDSGSTTVVGTEVRDREKTVYNFEVDDWHSYFIGNSKQNAVWVHNSNGCPYPVYFEMQLNPAAFGRRRGVHFNRANEALETSFRADRTLLEKVANHAGVTTDEMLALVSRAGGRQDPIGFTWHHATRAQAGGRSGVMQLVRHDPHEAFHGFYHPGNFGGYAEWAIPAGAPR
jgi:YD repeat-containing protein